MKEALARSPSPSSSSRARAHWQREQFSCTNAFEIFETATDNNDNADQRQQQKKKLNRNGLLVSSKKSPIDLDSISNGFQLDRE